LEKLVRMTKDDRYLATGFREVDAGGDSKLSRCLEFMQNMPCFQRYKRESLDRLQLKPGSTTIDLGCGLGADAFSMAQIVGPSGLSIGIDNSKRLIERALEIYATYDVPLRFTLADASAIPCEAGSADAIRVDRTLQHVTDPQHVVSEMVRVLRPGGRIVCCEPDWGTYTVNTADRLVGRAIADRWQQDIRNSWIGRQLREMLIKCGVIDVDLTGYLLFTDGWEAANCVFDMKATVEKIMADAAENCEHYTRWLERFAAEENLPCSASVTLFMTTGTKA
jgi:ubiquinone/menaquinone biosynthesis C-methylase UbiE